MKPPLEQVLLVLVLSAAAAQSNNPDATSRAAAAMKRAGEYAASGKSVEAAEEVRTAATLAPKVPGVWYALGQAYNRIKQEALATFDSDSDVAWRQLLSADALMARNQWVDAFVLYRAALERLPAMITIHDSVARIYEQTGHAAWAVRERAQVRLSSAGCEARRALCAFRAGSYRSALTAALAGSDAEARYWRARAANELALEAFERLDALPDSVERRAVRATVAESQERYPDEILELQAALKLSPGQSALTYQLALAFYSAREYDQAIATSSGLLQAHPDDIRLLRLQGLSLLQLQQQDEALPILERVVQRDPADTAARLALGRACVQARKFADAVPLIEPQLGADDDGSLHIQLARAYAGLGQPEKAASLLAQAESLQRSARERAERAPARRITPPR
jgi:predicted Zn-dependent protease